MYSIHLKGQRYKVIGLNGGYVLSYLLLLGLIQAGPTHDYRNAFLTELIGLPLKISFALLVCEWLMQKFLFKKKIILFTIGYISLIILFALLQRLIDNKINIPYFLVKWEISPLFDPVSVLFNIFKLQFFVTVPFFIRLLVFIGQEQQQRHEIATEKAQTELAFLRGQFHPHFLFNALNSLYAKILQGSDGAADMVLKLADLLRFAVYDTSQKMISLEKEISYLQAYIELQRARFDDRIDVSFHATGKIAGKTIEPFLLMPFIENSFKYGISDANGSGWVTILITVSGNWLSLKIENSHDGPPVQGKFKGRSGVGLQNVKKRLQLLYPDRHTLKITESEESYFVHLKLEIGHI